MSDTFLEQLVKDEAPVADAQAPVPEPTPAPPVAEPAATGDRPRNPDGTFAPKAKDEGSETGVKQPEAAAPQQQPQPEPPSGDEGKHVPLAALNALKQKLAEREAELAKYTAQPKAAEQSQQPPPQTPKSPDFSFELTPFDEDPRAHFDERLHQMKLQTSATFAVQQFGEQKFTEAWAAFDQAAKSDPRANAVAISLRDHPHPMGEVVKWYDQQQEISKLQEAGGLEKLREAIRAQLMAEMQGQQPAPAAPAANGAAPAAVPMPKPAAPAIPPSLAVGGAGSRNAPERPSDNEVFEAIFDKSKRQSRKR